MASLQPFRAVRYANLSEAVPTRLISRLSQVSAPAYRDLARKDPHHAANLFGAADPASMLRQWVKEGVVVEDGGAAFYLLEATGGPEPARFLIGALEGTDAQPLEAGYDRPDLPSLEPVVALAADDHHVLRQMLAEAASLRPPDVETQGPMSMRLWRLQPSRLWRRLTSHLEELRLRTLTPIPESGHALAAVAPLSDPGLSFKPIHRGIRGVPTFHPERFLAVVGGYARIVDLEARLTTEEGLATALERLASLATGMHAVLLVLPDGEGKILRFRQRLELGQIRAARLNPTLRSLDLALLNALVFKTVLGIQDAEEVSHPQVFAIPSLAELVEKVSTGVFQAGFVLNPPPLWEVRAVMEAEQFLPPHTTSVQPMPPAGLLFLAPD